MFEEHPAVVECDRPGLVEVDADTIAMVDFATRFVGRHGRHDQEVAFHLGVDVDEADLVPREQAESAEPGHPGCLGAPTPSVRISSSKTANQAARPGPVRPEAEAVGLEARVFPLDGGIPLLDDEPERPGSKRYDWTTPALK